MLFINSIIIILKNIKLVNFSYFSITSILKYFNKNK